MRKPNKSHHFSLVTKAFHIPMSKHIATISILLLMATMPAIASPSVTSLKTLRNTAPILYRLYTAYPTLHQQLGTYADTQGFRQPHERLATILHELIHIDSAAQNAYIIDDAAYAPYNQPTAWPKYNFTQFRETRGQGHVPDIWESTETAVFRLYITNAPKNTLANLADELNAYSQTAPWICKYASTERSNTLQSFQDMTRLTNAYLRALRVDAPTQYHALYNQQKQARNLLALTALNALNGLTACGIILPQQERDELDTLTARAQKEAGRK